MGHYCPDCGCQCHCHGDIDDLMLDLPHDQAVCDHCPDDCFDEEDHGDYYDLERDCPTCHGSGRVPTKDYESYLGEMYKPCPACMGDLNAGGTHNPYE